MKVGVLSLLNITPEGLTELAVNASKTGGVKKFSLAGANGNVAFSFYDSLNTLQMALNKGDVDEIELPEPVAEYMLNTNSNYEISSIVKGDPVLLSFGFRKSDDSEMREKINEALRSMKVAVTGDLPPIDYVAPDGKPDGFSIAILAEICRRLHVNIELINIDAGARAASLASGRSDVVFWFQSVRGDKNGEAPDEIVLSETYCTWNETLHIKKK